MKSYLDNSNLSNDLDPLKARKQLKLKLSFWIKAESSREQYDK